MSDAAPADLLSALATSFGITLPTGGVDPEGVPPRVLAAEERRRQRERRELRWTPGERAVMKQGRLDLHEPGAEPLTEEEQRLAQEEIERVSRQVGGHPRRNPMTGRNDT